MVFKPVSSKHRYLIQLARFFKKMGGTWHDRKPFLAVQQAIGLLIQFDHAVIVAANNQ